MRSISPKMQTRPRYPWRRLGRATRYVTAGLPVVVGLLGVSSGTVHAQTKVNGGGVVTAPKSPIIPKSPMTVSISKVLMGHNNVQNTGEIYTETVLNPTSVFLDPNNIASGKFGKLFTRPLDGAAYAQPLYVPNVYFPTVPHQTLPVTPDSYHNVVYVATEHNSVYAYDADDNTNNNLKPLWYKTFNYPSLLIGPVSSDEVGTVDIQPEISITGTPIITTAVDPVTKGTTGTMFLVSKVRNNTDFYQYLHAIDLVTGAEKFGGPFPINAAVSGTGDDAVLDANGNPVVRLNALNENQQAALKMLSDGTLVIAFGGHGEINPLHGWIVTYKVAADQKSIVQTGAFCLSPNGSADANGVPAGAGVWAGGAGPAIDEFDNIIVATGIGNFNVDLGGTEYAQSIVKLNFNAPNNGTAVPPNPSWPVVDYFTPFDWSNQTSSFSDLGSGGVVVLPAGIGPASNPNLAVAAGIEGTIYVVDRGTTALAQVMGGFNAGDDSQVVQSLPRSVGPVYGVPAFSTPTRTLFYQGSGDVLKAFTFGQDPLDLGNFGYLGNGATAAAPVSDVYGKSGVFDYPGSTPSISGDGVTNPAGPPVNQLVWTLEKQVVPSNVNDDPDINPTTAFFFGPYNPIGALTPIGVLHAYDANPAHWVNGVIPQVYSALATGARDTVPDPCNFAVPTVANGKVYVGSNKQLTVFGMYPTGVAPTGAQADHFLVSGPVNYWVSVALSGGATDAIAINQKQTVHFMITAIGPDNQPIKLNSLAHVYYRDLDNGSLHAIANVSFANSANAILPYAFTTVNNNGYDLYVVDDYGHNSVQPNASHPFIQEQSTAGAMNMIQGLAAAPIVVRGTNTRGLDHFVVQASSLVKNGGKVAVTIKTVTATGVLLPLNGTIPIYDAVPAGMGADGTPVPIQQFDNQPTGRSGWAYNNVPYLGQLFPFVGLQNVTFKNGIGVINYPVSGLGPHVIVVTSGGVTGTAVVTAVK